MMMVMRAEIRRNACTDIGAKNFTEDIMLSAVGIIIMQNTVIMNLDKV